MPQLVGHFVARLRRLVGAVHFAQKLVGREEVSRALRLQDHAVHTGLQDLREEQGFLWGLGKGEQGAGPVGAGGDQVLERDDPPVLGLHDDDAFRLGGAGLGFCVADLDDVTQDVGAVAQVVVAIYDERLESGAADVGVALVEDDMLGRHLVDGVQQPKALVDGDVAQIDPEGDARPVGGGRRDCAMCI
jgi:hypothetical protein